MGGWVGGCRLREVVTVAKADMTCSTTGAGRLAGMGGGGHGRVGAKVGEGRGRGLGRGVVGDKGEGVAEGSHGLLVLRASLGRGR